VDVVLGAPPEEVLWIEPVDEPSPAQRVAFQAWTGAAPLER
jgi:hypothetical protein